MLYVLGLMIKQSKFIKDWCIPWIILIIGICGTVPLMGFNTNSIIQGVLISGVTVFGNQLIKQTTVKSKEEQDK